MIRSDQVLKAQLDPAAREALLEASLQDICRYASKVVGRWIDRHDDLYSVALIAFNDAITAYDPTKGPFPAFATKVIANRITDTLRQDRNHIPFSDLETQDNWGDTIPFDMPDHRISPPDLSLEILSLQQELKAFGISFCDLPAASPKANKTRRACVAAARALQQTELMDRLLTTGKLPAKELLQQLPLNEKILERHRAYIIAGALILCGGYGELATYFLGGAGL